MKKLLALLTFAAIMLTGCAGGQTSESTEGSGGAKQTLKFYNWGEYIGENVIADFEKEYDADVISEYFDSNEAMYTKLKAGDVYDVLVPSDYMIERLMNEGMLQPLDKEKITNIGNIADGLKNRSFDPDDTYSIPYFWGTVGLVYDKTQVDISDLENDGYNILKNTKYKGNIYVYDSERDAFMVALKALGYSMNTENEDEINAAYEWLKEMDATMEPSYVTDEVIDAMVNANKAIAVVYSGDAAYALSQNENLGFYLPSEGTNIWSDAMVIPANAENPELANEFINYILTYDASYDNSYTVGYTSSNAEVVDELSTGDGEYADNEAYLPRVGYEKDEIFHDNETLRVKLSELWSKVKAE